MTTDHKGQPLTMHQVFMLPCNELEKKCGHAST